MYIKNANGIICYFLDSSQAPLLEGRPIPPANQGQNVSKPRS